VSDMQKFWYQCKTDRRFYFQNCLRIRTLTNGAYSLHPFLLNEEQEKILNAVEEQEYERKPVRIIILKARKMGCSTLIEALGHHMCQFNPSVYAKVVAHLSDSTKEIFEITKRYQTNLPEHFNIAPAKIIGNSIQWKHGSKFKVETQGSTDSARGGTPNFVHISELGLWWKKRRASTDEDVLQAQMGSLDTAPGTYCIIESTANGASGAFYDRFWQAYKNEPGNLFKALFFGWQEHSRYRLKASAIDERLHKRMKSAFAQDNAELFFQLASDLGYSEVWAKRASEFDLSAGQVRWAFQTLKTKFSDDLGRFDTEYPLTPQIAFTSSSKSPFNQAMLAERIADLKDEPPEVKVGSALIDTDIITLEPGPDNWRIWHAPLPDHKYLVTIDSAHGTEDGDFSCVQVIDQTSHQQVAEFYARVPPDIVAIQAAIAAKIYNWALLAPEVDGLGLAVVRTLLDLDAGGGYPNIYVRSLQGNWSQRFGFRTGAKGKRDAAVAALAAAIRLGSWDFYSERLLGECQTFIENAYGKCEAMPGEHDDAVMSMAIALYLDSEVGDDSESVSESKPVKKYEPGTVGYMLENDAQGGSDPHLGSIW